VAREGGGYTVRVMPLEEYVAGVLFGEAARDSNPAALEALAIAIRTYALANLGRHGADGFDLCDLTHCQVLRKSTPTTERAAAATAGRILLHNGAPASIFYTASCGGRTEKPSEVWPGADDPAYLPSRADSACRGEPAWTADLTSGELLTALRAGGFKGDRLRGVTVVGRNASGRVTRLRLSGMTPDEISGQDLRAVVGRTLGWLRIKSTAFELRRDGAAFHFSGHGYGHGVGMCVIGSVNLGADGRNADQILAHYFPGLRISTLPALPSASPARVRSDIVVSLPTGDEGERAAIEDLTARARDALVKELGVPAPARITLRFHPTVESYQRATGQPWFTDGATLGTEVQFVPLTVLHQRGVLERTVRHELVHVLTEPTLVGRPLWIREGAATYFGGERPTAGETPARAAASGRIVCPTDRELSQPTSPGALGMAAARASACFTRQLHSGKRWADIK